MKTSLLIILCICLAFEGEAQTLSDDFNGNQLNALNWQPFNAFGDTTVTETNGYVRLQNGGKILTQASFGSPLEINGRFQFSGNVHDVFILVIRTTATTYPGSIELTNGIAIRINPENDTSSEFCTFTAQRMNDSFLFGMTNRTFLMNQFYNFRVIDSGTNFSFYFEDLTTPLLSGTDSLSLGQKVGLYNREGSGGGSSISAGSQVDIDFLDIASPSFCSPHRATAVATLTNGFVIGANITDPGCGYTNAPVVLIQGGGGTGATATAAVSNGIVTAINFTSAGCCYTNAPKIVIASPPFVPTVDIAVSKVKVTQHVVLGRNYILESSTNLVSWTATGPQFTADTESIASEFDVDVFGRYFRLREVP